MSVKKYLILIGFMSITLISAGPKFKTFKITEGVKASLPADFTPMSDDDLAIKYPSTKKPLAMFTNPDRIVDFGLNVSKSKWPGNDLNLLQKVYKTTLADLYNKIEFKQEVIKEIYKRKFIVFEFFSVFEGQKNYTYLQYTLVKDQVYLFNFTCPAHLASQWQEVAHKTMSSIKMTVSQPVEVIPPTKPGVKKYIPKKVPMKQTK